MRLWWRERWRGKEEAFFFEKKNQKTFFCLVFAGRGLMRAGALAWLLARGLHGRCGIAFLRLIFSICAMVRLWIWCVQQNLPAPDWSMGVAYVSI
jgi:hypothetical protein